MTIAPRTKEQLTAFLGNLSNAAALKLFSALENDKLRGGEGLPHDELLEALRAKLLNRGAILPPRAPDAKRIFFSPFEDFFINQRSGKKQRVQISRTSLNPIWALMMSDKQTQDAASAATRLDENLQKGAAPGAETNAQTEERMMFIAAEAGLARICDQAKADDGARERLIERLGGEDVLRDLDEIGQLITGVDLFRQLHEIILSPAPPLGEEQLYELRSLFLSAHEQSSVLASYLLLAIKGRLEKPWRSLRVYYHLARSADDALQAARDAAAVLPEALFNEFEEMARALERDGARELDARATLMRVSYFADYADGLAGQAAKIGDNVFLNRVEACRDVAGEAFERFGELALAQIRAATPVRQAGGSTRLMTQRPEFALSLGDDLVDAAHNAAALAAQSPALAKRLGVDVSYSSGIADDARAHLDAYAKDLIVEIRAAEGAERQAAKIMLKDILTIAEPILDSDDIGLIRDRAAAAAVTV